MKKLNLFLVIIAMMLSFGCASSDGQADKETHVVPQQTTGDVNLTVPTPPASSQKYVVYNFHGPLVSINQEMKIEDSALKGGNQDGAGGEADQTTKPVTDFSLRTPIDESIIPGVPDILPDLSPIVPDPGKPTKETCTYYGRYNPDRPTWYCNRDMKDYPKHFVVNVKGCESLNVTNNDGVRFEEDGKTAKQSSEDYRPMALVWPANCTSAEDASLIY